MVTFGARSPETADIQLSGESKLRPNTQGKQAVNADKYYFHDFVFSRNCYARNPGHSLWTNHTSEPPSRPKSVILQSYRLIKPAFGVNTRRTSDRYT